MTDVKWTVQTIVRELLSGISVSLTLVPTSIAYALFLGMSPMVGLYASIIMVLTTAILGSQPGLVSNTTAAVAVAMIGLVQKMGPEYLFVGVIVGGILQLFFVFLKLERVFKLVPPQVVSGFLLGLAALIAKGQINYFRSESYFNKDNDLTTSEESSNEAKQTIKDNVKSTIDYQKNYLLTQLGLKSDRQWLSRDKLLATIGVTLFGVAIMFGTHFAKIPLPGSVPGSLLTVIIITAAYYISPWKVPISTIGDKGSVGGKLPTFRIPNVPWNLKTLWTVLPYSASMAVSTLTESMLMMKKATEVLHKGGDSRRENMAMGLGNIISGFFGGMGGNVCVGLSQLNLANGGRTRLSTITAGLALVLIMLFFSKWVQAIPMPALIAIMVFIVYETGDWTAFNNTNNTEKLVILVTSVMSFLTSNLAAGVVSGTLLHHAAKNVKL